MDREQGTKHRRERTRRERGIETEATRRTEAYAEGVETLQRTKGAWIAGANGKPVWVKPQDPEQAQKPVTPASADDGK